MGEQREDQSSQNHATPLKRVVVEQPCQKCAIQRVRKHCPQLEAENAVGCIAHPLMKGPDSTWASSTKSQFLVFGTVVDKRRFFRQRFRMSTKMRGFTTFWAGRSGVPKGGA